MKMGGILSIQPYMNKNLESHSEIEIVNGCIRNERFFQELLYRRHFPAMMRMCLRYTSDRDQAMEIINNGFLRVFKKIEQFQFKGSLEGWIRKLVYHCMADYFKNNQRYVQFMVFEDRDEQRVVQEQATVSCYVDDLMQLVTTLPDTTQKVFKLYAVEGYTHDEIGKLLGISDGTSKWHLSSARQRLKHALGIEQQYYINAQYNEG
jgi:RNA polymerase sigma factor (sigma-70 family)